MRITASSRTFGAASVIEESGTSLLPTIALICLLLSLVSFTTTLALAREVNKLKKVSQADPMVWPSMSLRPGASIREITGWDQDAPDGSFLTSGFYLFMDSNKNADLASKSLSIVCDRWGFDYRLVMSNKYIDQSAVRVTDGHRVIVLGDYQQSNYRLPNLTYIFVRDEAVIDAASGLMYPQALRGRFQMACGR